MIACVMALEAALLPCLPARELQVIDRSPHPSHQIDVERHARDFMEAAKKLQLYFIGLQREDQPTKVETLGKGIFLVSRNIGGSALGKLPKSQLNFPFKCPIRQIRMAAHKSILSENNSESKGALIVLEGLDRSGKTSLSSNLRTSLGEELRWS